jgi:hypothetical protein
VSYVDRDTCIPLRTELSRDERVRKVVEVDLAWVEAMGDRFVARRWRIEDLSEGSHTRLSLERVRLDTGEGGSRTARARPNAE